jgi:hypothetical protein
MRQKFLIAIAAFVLGAATMWLPSAKARPDTVTIDTDTDNIGQVIFENYPLYGDHGTWEIIPPVTSPPNPPTSYEVRIVFDSRKPENRGR